VELWKSNGTAAGTVLVKNIDPGGGSSYPSNLTNVSGTLFFAATDGTHGVELWKSNGTVAGTVLVKDIDPGSGNSNPSNLTNVNGTLFFAATDVTHGVELWKTNGTGAGTVMVKDIDPGSAGSAPSWLTSANGLLYFAANDGTHGTELWQSNGTAAGTVMVQDINPGSVGSYPSDLTVSGTNLFFAANDGVHGVEPWVLSLASGSTTAVVTATRRHALETPATVASGGVLAGAGAGVVGTGYPALQVTGVGRATLRPRLKGLVSKPSRAGAGGAADDFQAGASGWAVVMGPATSPVPPPAGPAALVGLLPNSDFPLVPARRHRARVVPEMIDRFLTGVADAVAI
jgi:ELWxxDGT repeat protein